MKLNRIEGGTRSVLAYFEALNRHEVAGMMAFLSDDCLLEGAYGAPDGEIYQGQEAVARHWTATFDRTPEMQVDIEEVFGLGNRCVVRWRRSGPGGRADVRGVDVFELRGPVITADRSYVKGL